MLGTTFFYIFLYLQLYGILSGIRLVDEENMTEEESRACYNTFRLIGGSIAFLFLGYLILVAVAYVFYFEGSKTFVFAPLPGSEDGTPVCQVLIEKYEETRVERCGF